MAGKAGAEAVMGAAAVMGAEVVMGVEVVMGAVCGIGDTDAPANLLPGLVA
jgi:hypothetical protein